MPQTAKSRWGAPLEVLVPSALAVAVAMTWNYLVVAAAAILLYLVAALFFPVLPADTSSPGD